MAFDHRRSMSYDEGVQDPRFDLFCKWLATQNIANQSLNVGQRNTKRNLESDEFLDAEKEQSPPESVKELIAVKPEMVIPVIIPPMNDSPDKDLTSATVEVTDRDIIVPDGVKLRRKLHSPKKGRAPEPPISPINLPNAPVSQGASHVHLETII